MTPALPRRYMLARLSEASPGNAGGIRCPLNSDVPRLAKLMLAAYSGTTDDEGETEHDALVEIEKTFKGEYGAFLPECSKLVERNGELLSATLITIWEGLPFVAFSFTAPTSKRTGLARACMVSAMQELFARGDREIRLMVTLANLPARTLYESLGFTVQE